MQALGVAVRQQALLAHLASEAAVLDAPEEGGKIGPLKLIDPDAARLKPPRDAFSPRQVR